MTRLSWNEIRARAAHPGATLADLYDPDLMPPNLRKNVTPVKIGARIQAPHPQPLDAGSRPA